MNIFFLAAGAAYGRAENEIKKLVELSGLPFLPTPMGKGVLPDDHPNCVAAARSRSVWLCSNAVDQFIECIS